MSSSMPKRKSAVMDTELLELGDRRLYQPQRVARSRNGMVASAHYEATAAGVEAMEMGGNAFDAAVAAAFALGVCEPAASGLGGQTMVLFYHAVSNLTLALDGSSRAPNRTSLEVLTREDRRRGHRAATVPSTPAALDYLRRRYGKLKLSRLLGPAIRLADQGYQVSALQSALSRRELKHLRAGTAAPFFLRDGRKSYPAGAVIRQPVLAETLRHLAKKGIRDFYRGEIAERIHQDMERNDGLIHRDDLAQIPRPIERRPVTGRYAGHRVFTFPPPGAGRTLVEIFNMHQSLPEKYQDPDTPQGAVALAETIRRAFLDRRDRPFDPAYYAQVSEKRMLSLDYAHQVARQTARRLSGHGETTHLSVMDAEGNAVALTQSIERVYGSFSATSDLGFLYNNYMSAFEYADISHPYHLRPNAAPWASVAPTIVFRGKRPWLAIGSPGSERIAPSIFQVMLRLEYETPYISVEAPRLHCTLDGKVSLEASRMDDEIPKLLERHGFEVVPRDPYSFYLGCVQLVVRDKNRFVGVADPRRDGAAGAPSESRQAVGKKAVR